MDVPSLVTFHLFRVAQRHVPLAIGRMGLDRWALRRAPGLRFWKLLGTGDGRTFDARDADPRTWGLLAVWGDHETAARFCSASSVIRGWNRISSEAWRADLRPLSSRGRWSGDEPFGRPHGLSFEGPVAVITRARLRARKMRRFWYAVPPVNADLERQPGLRFSVGIGEAPVGLQGTFSIWGSAEDLRRFAYRSAAHRDVIRRTHAEGWYAEELFARFAVLDTHGTLHGRDPARSA